MLDTATKEAVRRPAFDRTCHWSQGLRRISATGRDVMTNCCAISRSLLLAGTFAGLFAWSAAAQAPPGFSPLDKSNPAASKQDANLKPHPTPPIATAQDKLPVDKIKLPAGFKAEVVYRPSRRAHHG